MCVLQAQPSVLPGDVACSSSGVELITNALFELSANNSLRDNDAGNLPSSAVNAKEDAADACAEQRPCFRSSISHASGTFQELPPSALDAIMHERACAHQAETAHTEAVIQSEGLQMQLDNMTEKYSQVVNERDNACMRNHTLMIENAAIVQQCRYVHRAVTETHQQIFKAVDRGLIDVLTQHETPTLGTPVATTPNKFATAEVIQKLRELIDAKVQPTEDEKASTDSSAESNILVATGARRSLRTTMRVASKSPAAAPPCMHTMRDSAADEDSSESSLRWTPSSPAHLSSTPSPTGDAAATADAPSITRTIDDSVSMYSPNPTSLHLASTAVRQSLSFADVVRMNLAQQQQEFRQILNSQTLASPQLLAQKSTHTAVTPHTIIEGPTLTSHPLSTPSVESLPLAATLADAEEPCENVSVSLTPNANGRVNVEFQPRTGASWFASIKNKVSVCSFPMEASESVFPCEQEQELSSAFHTARSPAQASHSLTPTSITHPSVACTTAALDAVNLAGAIVGETPMFSPPDYHLEWSPPPLVGKAQPRPPPQRYPPSQTHTSASPIPCTPLPPLARPPCFLKPPWASTHQ